MTDEREMLKEKKRVVIKIGSSSLTHKKTGDLNLLKIEKLIRIISDLRGEGRDVVLVSSGAIAAGRQAFRRAEAAPDDFGKAGLCGGRTGAADDGISEAFFLSITT